ncbi:MULTISPECIES: chromate efflux transporter [Dyadobacter]|uniref:Chromate efflux transporter n=1 Tax=Dyadobacter chenhuakuii TaxID=2909339 RepID=A0A9X1QI83_9BACT|nr:MULTISPECIES: chromate efflux transporter [Dyadobacter]MCE7071360.1 chromate efflux transporter [Dyadobacter sp. CY327]MCF2500733.1 chromate efflux transporter [Dyadobacter chenhuakuii]MCF2518001.1 chromate efflux transporter [Dyadobacter sp. CY351]
MAHPPIRRFRYIIYLTDILLLSVTAFGGPQVHLMMMIERLVRKRRYITEEELLELQALCSVLPGPSSTQTVTAIGLKIGGQPLAYLTLIVWSLPAMILMTLAAIGIHYLERNSISLQFTKFVGPMAVAFLMYGASSIAKKVIHNTQGWSFLVIATILAYMYPSPYMTPVLIVSGGVAASLNFKKHEKMERGPIRILWRPIIFWISVLIAAAIVGKVTNSLPVRLFENFYRNGSLVFGGGQVLVPILYNEFVEFKHYLTDQEFLAGMALTQVVPGPVFSIATFVGSISLQSAGITGQIVGGFVATAGIFLPGTFFIFFAYPFWDQLKRYRGIRASLEGIHAASCGLTIAAAISLFQPMMSSTQPMLTVIATILVLTFSKVPSYVIIVAGLVLGLVF